MALLFWMLDVTMKFSVLVAAFLMCLAGAGAAWAESPEQREAARQAYTTGDLAFKEGRYEDALTAFQQGYELSHRARFLLNVAHTQRKLGQMREALATYKRFLLTDPKPADRSLAEQMVKEVDALLAEEDALKATSGPPLPSAADAPPAFQAAPPVVMHADASAAPAPPPLVQRWYFWAGLGALVAAGVVVGVALSGGGDPGRTNGSWGELRL